MWQIDSNKATCGDELCTVLRLMLCGIHAEDGMSVTELGNDGEWDLSWSSR